VLRDRLKCGANDGDPGVAGYTLFVLGYLGDDSGAKSFLQTQTSAGGDVGTIAKAALYLMGDATQKAAVQAGLQSSSVFVKVACAGALGIVDKDDASVTSVIIPEIKWIEPDNMGGETDNGKGMYSAHILEIVAMDRRGWIPRGAGDGAVTFYGETGGPCTTCVGTGGTSGAGGTSGTAGAVGSGGSSGTAADGRVPAEPRRRLLADRPEKAGPRAAGGRVPAAARPLAHLATADRPNRAAVTAARPLVEARRSRTMAAIAPSAVSPSCRLSCSPPSLGWRCC
jgi:hypothetical protein